MSFIKSHPPVVVLAGHVHQHELLALVRANSHNNSLHSRSNHRSNRCNRHDSLRIRNNHNRNLFKTEKHKKMRNNKKKSIYITFHSDYKPENLFSYFSTDS